MSAPVQYNNNIFNLLNERYRYGTDFNHMTDPFSVPPPPPTNNTNEIKFKNSNISACSSKQCAIVRYLGRLTGCLLRCCCLCCFWCDCLVLPLLSDWPPYHDQFKYDTCASRTGYISCMHTALVNTPHNYTYYVQYTQSSYTELR